MKARVYVSYKKTVLDPQGQAIQKALNAHGHPAITHVRQGKFFEIDLEATDTASAEAELDHISKDVLANPVIEEYRIELLS